MFIFLTQFIQTWKLFGPELWQQRRLWWRWALTFSLIFLDVYCVTQLPFLWKKILEQQLSIHMLGFSALMYVGFWLLHEGVSYVQDIIFFPIINGTIYSLQKKVVNHLHQIAYVDHQKQSTPKIVSAMKRISQSSRNFLRVNLLLLLPCVLKLLINGAMIAQNPLYGAIFGVGLLIFFVCLAFLIPQYGRIRNQAWNITDEVGNVLTHSLLQTQIVREHLLAETARLEKVLQQELRLWWKTNTRLNGVHIVMSLALAGVILVPLMLGIYDYAEGRLAQEALIVLQAQLFLMAVPLRHLILEVRQLLESIVDIEKIIEIFHIRKSKYERLALSKNGALIWMDGVSFGFKNQDLLFHQINLDIRKGKKIFICGANGVGKSTLMNLLSGTIQHPDIHRDSRVYCFYIPQGATLMNGTLLDNLVYGLSIHPDMQSIEYALRKMGIWELVGRLDKGLDTVLGDLGGTLSGGERQRILLTRALLHKPDVLILDEAMDRIDIEHRLSLHQILWNVVPTIIWTSHHANSADWATEVWQIKNAHIHKIK